MAEKKTPKRRVARADPKTGHIRVQGRVGGQKATEKPEAPTRQTTRIPMPRRVPKEPPAVTAPTTAPRPREPLPLLPDEPEAPVEPEPPRPARRVAKAPAPKPEPEIVELPVEPAPPEPGPGPEPVRGPAGPPTPRREVLKAPVEPAAPIERPAPRPVEAPEPRPTRRVLRDPEPDLPARPPFESQGDGPPAPTRRQPVAEVKAPHVTGSIGRMDTGTPWREMRAPAQEEDLVKAMKRQSRLRARQEEKEAERLGQEAKALLKKAKNREKFERELSRHQRYVSSLGSELGLDPRRPVTEIPPLPPGHRQVELEEFSGGLAYVRISYDSNFRRYLYEVLEPHLTETEGEACEFLRDTLIRTLDGRRDDGQDWAEYLTEAIHTAIRDHSVLLDAISTQRVRYHLLRDFLGYGPIDVLMQDPMIEDISCDGPNIPLYLFHRQYESLRTNVEFDKEERLDGFVIRLAQMSGKHISIADPLLDATLPDGSRLQSTLSKEVTTRGSSFTIRKFRGDPLTPPDLVHFGTMSPEMAGYFWFLMEHGMSLILAGGTASGKTTSLNAVCQFIPPQKKVVSIEDTREINLDHENWIAGVTRSGFGGESMMGKKSGTIDMYDLLEAALRQRPEFLLVGEVRGPEALTLFQAMATGHAVYSTMHADSVTSAVYRLENPPINVPRMMLQTVDAIAVQQQVRMGERMMRRITEVTEVVGFEPETGDLLTNTVFEWDVAGDRHGYTGKSYVLEHVMALENLTEAEVETEWANRVRVIEWMIHKGIRRYDQVARTVAHYYRDPTDLLEQISLDERAMGYRVEVSQLHVTPPVPEAVERIPEPPADDGEEE